MEKLSPAKEVPSIIMPMTEEDRMLPRFCKLMLNGHQSPIWLPPQRLVDPLALILPNLFTSRDSAVNSTITRLKQYFKDAKAKSQSSRQTEKKQTTLKRRLRKTLKMYSTDQNSKNMLIKPQVRNYSIQKNAEEFNTGSARSTDQQQLFVEKLANQIEATEVDRLNSEADNPLKYTVKDGILYKKNKIPVARITFPPMKNNPLPMVDRVQDITRIRHTNAVLNTPPIFSDRGALPSSVNQTATVYMKPKRKTPNVPFTPPTTRVWRDESKAPTAVDLNANISKPQVAVVPSVVRSAISHMEKSGRLSSNDIMGRIREPPPYPFSHCYMNIDGSGFLCCNRYLESVMRQSYRKLRKTYHFHECSVQKIVNRIQMDCEQAFNTTFETIVGLDDFAMRVHFAGDLMCKIQEGGRFITAYATMMPTRKGVPPDPLHVVTNIEMDLREKETPHPQSASALGTKTQALGQSDVLVQRIRVPNVPGFGRGDQEDIPFFEKSREDIDNDNLIFTRTA
ncbi:hypothetical protein KIN20_012611 [Parelaphostrongylus tenuis]|uniref:Ground-like domain-containing protein n=1 Tax=Parelaphostrongylus tenuis TaxID=148309 RepID=A0AAD5MB10_PARTN|nr:hypothetical protein KIN20_012611 [Parelaphostrongylus tenuis]